MLQELLEHAQLAILPGKPAFGFDEPDLYDEAYRFWVAYWTATRREVGLAGDRLDADDFLRHDVVHVLRLRGKVIGMINCTLLDFARAPAAAHSYVNTYFGAPFVQRLKSLKLLRMATLENIYLDGTYRSARVGFSLGAVLMTEALRKVADLGCDGVFGCPRKDAPTARICADLGARTLVKDLVFHGKPTDLVAWSQADVRAHPNASVVRLADHLWNDRLDTLTRPPVAHRRAS